jgi:hypothetical protein
MSNTQDELVPGVLESSCKSEKELISDVGLYRRRSNAWHSSLVFHCVTVFLQCAKFRGSMQHDKCSRLAWVLRCGEMLEELDTNVQGYSATLPQAFLQRAADDEGGPRSFKLSYEGACAMYFSAYTPRVGHDRYGESCQRLHRLWSPSPSSLCTKHCGLKRRTSVSTDL